MAKAIYQLAVVKGVAFERSHQVMKALADSWENMQTIPLRTGVAECFEEVGDGVQLVDETIPQYRGGWSHLSAVKLAVRSSAYPLYFQEAPFSGPVRGPT
ncbi:unnamed protein product [Sphacelaria rigidula]